MSNITIQQGNVPLANSTMVVLTHKPLHVYHAQTSQELLPILSV